MYVYYYVYFRTLPGFVYLPSRIENASSFFAVTVKEATAFMFQMHNDSCGISVSHSSVAESCRPLGFYAVSICQ